MTKVRDIISGKTYEFESGIDTDEIKKDFDKTVWDMIDTLAICHAFGEYTGDFESYLGIEITED